MDISLTIFAASSLCLYFAS